MVAKGDTPHYVVASPLDVLVPRAVYSILATHASICAANTGGGVASFTNLSRLWVECLGVCHLLLKLYNVLSVILLLL